MFALRGYAPQARQLARIPRQASTVLQQTRAMSGGDDEDDSLYVNWWDAPTKPDLWHRHQLAWWAFGAWGLVFYTAFGGKKKEEKPAAS